MSDPLNWKIPPDSEDWECDWESSRRFQINYWASLPLRDQIAAIEEMEKLGELLQPDRSDARFPTQGINDCSNG